MNVSKCDQMNFYHFASSLYQTTANSRQWNFVWNSKWNWFKEHQVMRFVSDFFGIGEKSQMFLFMTYSILFIAQSRFSWFIYRDRTVQFSRWIYSSNWFSLEHWMPFQHSALLSGTKNAILIDLRATSYIW